MCRNGHVTDNTEVIVLKSENFSVIVKSGLALLTHHFHFSVLLCRRGGGVAARECICSCAKPQVALGRCPLSHVSLWESGLSLGRRHPMPGPQPQLPCPSSLPCCESYRHRHRPTCPLCGKANPHNGSNPWSRPFWFLVVH